MIHDSIDSCSLRWSTGDIAQSSLGLPVDENGTFDLSLSNVQENTTVSIEATCGVWTESSMTVYASINIKEDEGEKGAALIHLQITTMRTQMKTMVLVSMILNLDSLEYWHAGKLLQIRLIQLPYVIKAENKHCQSL